MPPSWEKMTSEAKGILDRHRMPAYLVELEPGDSPRTANKILGAAYLLPSEAWPRCPHCAHKMALLLQVAVSDIVDAAPALERKGLLQFFMCLNSRERPDDRGPKCNGIFGWEIKADNNFIRVVVPEGEGSPDLPPDHGETPDYKIK